MASACLINSYRAVGHYPSCCHHTNIVKRLRVGLESQPPHKNLWHSGEFGLGCRILKSEPEFDIEHMRKIRVLLADDHTVVRQGLRALLAAEDDIEIVGEAENGRQALQLVKKLLPDVVVMDIAMPVLNGVEATRQITRYVPSVKVLVLSTYSNDEYVEQLTEAGAAGYLVKQTAANDLLKAIREAFKGNAFFSPAIAKRLRDQCRQTYTSGQPIKRRADYLTTREAEVLQLIAEGRANKQIAAELCISIKTVEKHRQQVMNKLGIHDVAGLTRHAISKGIIESNATGLQPVG
jgi:DNA-binding NarL/FixJ family response regulator